MHVSRQTRTVESEEDAWEIYLTPSMTFAVSVEGAAAAYRRSCWEDSHEQSVETLARKMTSRSGGGCVERTEGAAWLFNARFVVQSARKESLVFGTYT
jgi:hypothetical protein